MTGSNAAMSKLSVWAWWNDATTQQRNDDEATQRRSDAARQ
jgi:hypothetical protein